MRRVCVVGAGRVGRAIAALLEEAGGYRVRVTDVEPAAAEAAARDVPGVEPFAGAMADALAGCRAVVSAAPFSANPPIAEAAAAAGVHYLDLTEDVAVTRKVAALAARAKTAFAPQCGVAPGFVSIAAVHVIRQFDSVDTLTLRTGALPRQPNNRLKYNLTWSTEGLVNQYVQPCEALRDGKIVLVPPLTGREEVLIDGVAYEAFATSGGVGSLCRTYEGRIRRLDYKTIRYPGHLELIRFLMDDLGFRDRPAELVDIFHRSIPATRDDFVLVSVRGLGRVAGRYEERTFWTKVAGRAVSGRFFTGIEIATAAGVCGVLHLLLDGALPSSGLVKMEDVPLSSFLATPFGAEYARGDGRGGIPG